MGAKKFKPKESEFKFNDSNSSEFHEDSKEKALTSNFQKEVKNKAKSKQNEADDVINLVDEFDNQNITGSTQ